MRPLAILLTISVAATAILGAACTRNCNTGCAYAPVLDISIPPDSVPEVSAIETLGTCTLESGPCPPGARTSPGTCSTTGITVRATGSGSCAVTVRFRDRPDLVVTPTLRHFEQSCGCNGDLFIVGGDPT